MKLNKEEQKLSEARQQVAKRRFQIEKLEERIAPAKGGIPGNPYAPGQQCGWGGVKIRGACHI